LRALHPPEAGRSTGSDNHAYRRVIEHLFVVGGLTWRSPRNGQAAAHATDEHDDCHA
jgi:hypothetical protein